MDRIVDQIGRYRILGELGRGAMGVVYQAQDPAIGRKIAIKSIRLSDLTEESERARLRERLFREAQSAGILSHPGIVTIYDIAEQDGMAYIFMELVNGPSLEKMLGSDHPPNKDTLLSILRQTAAALDYAHRKGIIHRDIKPANIMIHEDGAAKITDFGVAKIVSQQMTQAGTIMGTPSYMSPEQVQGGEITGKADQFSLAVIAYELLTGEKPFTADYLPTLLFKLVREEAAPPQRLNPTLSPQVEIVLRRALSKNPANRYETCGDFINALVSALHASGDWSLPAPAALRPASDKGSDENLAATVADTSFGSRGDMQTPAPAAEEPPPAAAPAPVEIVRESIPATRGAATEQALLSEPARLEAEPHLPPIVSERPAPSSHTLRNVILAAAVLAAAAAALFFIQPRTATPPAATPTTSPAAAPEAAATPALAPPETAKAAAPPPSPANAAPGAAVLSPTPAGPASSGPSAASTPAAPRTPASPAEVSFQITTTPPGAEAIFDENSNIRCTSPCMVNLPLGRHSVLLKHDGFRDARRVFNLPDDPGLIVNMDPLAGTLGLLTKPAGLTVIIDGQEQARKTPANFTLPAGPHKVAVIHGSDRQEFTVDIRDGGLSQKTIEWPQ
jgi:serine/threonine protein kinase